MSKKLKKGSVYEKLDTNGDGIVSDKEFKNMTYRWSCLPNC